MQGLDSFMGDKDLYDFDSSGTGDTLHYHEPNIDYSMRDLTGYTDQFDDVTRDFLNSNSGYNVVMWSWCGLDKDTTLINQYLTNMNQLEMDYPTIRFVYMTGHLEGTGEEGDLHYYNQMIRDHCINNNKTLYDFADIESYDPDDNYFLDMYADDNCTYSDDGNLTRDRNWAIEWQESHIGEWYPCTPAHSQALNGNFKAYAAWYLFAILAGWDGTS